MEFVYGVKRAMLYKEVLSYQNITQSNIYEFLLSYKLPLVFNDMRMSR